MALGDTDTFTADTLTQPEDFASSEGGPISAPISASTRAPTPMRTPTPRRAESALDSDGLRRAYFTLDFYQKNPQWLANPYTAHAAQAHLEGASKMVQMSIQLERVNSMADGAKTKTAWTKQKISDLSSVTPLVPSDDEAGQRELGRLNGMIGNDNFNLEDFSVGVARLQSRYKKPAPEFAPTELQRHWNEYRAAVESGNRDLAEAQWRAIQSYKAEKVQRPVTVTEKDAVTGIETTRRMTEEEAAKLTEERARQEAAKPMIPTPEEKNWLTTYAEDKAAIASGDYRGGFLNLSNRKRRLEENRNKLAQRGIDADTGGRLQKLQVPSPKAATTSAIPMPTTKSELKTGQLYATPRGDATWDGEKFVQ